jgi:hypothetical protein
MLLLSVCARAGLLSLFPATAAGVTTTFNISSLLPCRTINLIIRPNGHCITKIAPTCSPDESHWRISLYYSHSIRESRKQHHTQNAAFLHNPLRKSADFVKKTVPVCFKQNIMSNISTEKRGNIHCNYF